MKKNNDSQTILPDLPEGVSKNFHKLIKISMNAIEKICGNSGNWTNYNASDPGITILEVVCYAITDLGYRLSFPMKDLLEKDPDNCQENSSESILVPAKKILSVSPLTIKDYEKMLTDLEGVNKAKLEIIERTVAKDAKRFSVRGLYKVIIEPEGYIYEDNTGEKDLLNSIKEALEQNRNLSEDFAKIEILAPIQLKASIDVEITDKAHTNSITKEVWNILKASTITHIPTYSLHELLNQGSSIDKIFDGPALKHGFVLDKDIEISSPTRKIYLNNIKAALCRIEGIICVTKIVFSSEEERINTIDKNIVEFNSDVFPELNGLEINFLKHGVRHSKSNKVKSDDKDFYDRNSFKNTYLPMPKGKYRNLKGYTSIREEFPNNYCINSNSISNNILDKQHNAMVKQLEGYLLFFDQVMSNAFAQLDGFKKMFNYVDDMGLSEMKTYMSGKIESADISSIVYKNYSEKLRYISDPTSGCSDEANTRKGLILDYLLSIYGERFVDYSYLFEKKDGPNVFNRGIVGDEEITIETIRKQIKYLRTYPQINGYRARGVDYSKVNQKNWLIERIATYLDLTDSEKEEVFVVDHLLLLPYADDNLDSTIIDEFGDIYSYQISIIIPVEFFETLKPRICLIIDEAIPVHIRPNYYWLRLGDKQDFIELYHQWRKARAGFINDYELDSGNLDKASNNLARFLLDIDTRKEADDGGINNMIIEGVDIIKSGKLSRLVIG